MPFSSSPPNGGLVDYIDAIALADLGQLEAQRIERVDLRGIKSVQQQVHLAQQIRQRLGLAALERRVLQDFAVFNCFDLGTQVFERFNKETAGPAGGVEHHLTKLRVHDFHHEAHDRPRGIELAIVTRGIAHPRSMDS